MDESGLSDQKQIKKLLHITIRGKCNEYYLVYCKVLLYKNHVIIHGNDRSFLLRWARLFHVQCGDGKVACNTFSFSWRAMMVPEES